jgi:hypothetical protein
MYYYDQLGEVDDLAELAEQFGIDLSGLDPK